MSEKNEEQVVEKRVTRTVIRRRAKKTEDEAPKEAASEAKQVIEADAQVNKTDTPVVESLEAKPKEVVPVESKTEEVPKRTPVVKSATLTADEEKKAEKAKAKKNSLGKRSRDDLLMEEYTRAGGLKQVGALATLDDDDDVKVEHPMERIFQPEKQQRRGKRVTGKKDFKKTQVTTPSAKKRKIRIDKVISVANLAAAMSIKGTAIIQHLVGLGSMVSLNDTIDAETAEIIAAEFGFEIENIGFQEEAVLPDEAQESDEGRELRAPVVTIMGHVDHGKTSLIDYIRKAKVAEGEAGGITQHIGAYQVSVPAGKITFIDTPGHEAFTAMRARGAQVTDIVILVVAADDGVKPQTIEAINHAKAAEVPLIVAINKIDKPGINLEDIKRQLSEQGLLAEDWGGDTMMAPVSAMTGEGIDGLLEMVLLQSEVLELKANPNKLATGYVIEARLEKGRGTVVTAVIQEGTLKKGDPVVAGLEGGRARALHDYTGKVIKEAGPSTPVEIIGFSGVPAAGDLIHALASDKDVQRVMENRGLEDKASQVAPPKMASLEDLFAKIQEEEKVELRVVMKSDVDGSIEALRGSLENLSTDKVTLKILHSSVGAITESDVRLAQASNAIIVGFNVRPETKARKEAEQSGIDLKVYRVIYEAIDDIKKAMEGLLDPTYEEEYLGRAEVRDVFSVSKIGSIAGTSVVDGKVLRGCQIRVLRDGTIIHEGKISSLKRFKEDAKEVSQGYECGIGIENFNDVKVGDLLESYRMKEIAAKL